MNPLDSGDPDQIGRYRLTHRLGEGGMGRVYLGRTASGRKVVVKTIRAEHVMNSEFRARFAREVKMARRVGGFHTAQVVEANTEATEPWIASSYIQGPSLERLINSYGPLTEDSLRILAAGLAEGLQVIHGDKLTHRDLKPANIMIAQDGPRIIDFGISRPDEGTEITSTGAILGTPSYMAPEQIQAKHSQASPTVDIFALGTVLHFAATGNNPFKGSTALASVGLLLTTRPEVSQKVPEPLRTIITQCWHRTPEERISAEKILALLDTPDLSPVWPPEKSSTGRSIPEPTSKVWELPQGARGHEKWPDHYLIEQAQELRKKSETLRTQSRISEAFHLSFEEVELRKEIASRKLTLSSLSLAQALRSHADDLSELGSPEKAIDLGAQAIKIIRDLNPEELDTLHMSELIRFLNEYSFDLTESDLHEEALKADTQQMDLHRRLTNIDPNHTPKMGEFLFNYSTTLRSTRRYKEALNALKEARHIFRELSLSNPEHYIGNFEEAVRETAILKERHSL